MSALELQSIMNAAAALRPLSVNRGRSEEHSLVAKAKSGHSDAFGELYNRHQHKAYCTALRILRNQQDAEDAVQRAFHRALLNLPRFREDSAFATWLTRIVINEALMLLRGRRTREPRYENDVEVEQGDRTMEIADGRPTPEEIVCESERHATLRQAIAGLRENLRVVVLHKELQGLTNAETARRLGLSVSAVKARGIHARRLLRKNLERNLKRTRLRSMQSEKGTGSIGEHSVFAGTWL